MDASALTQHCAGHSDLLQHSRAAGPAPLPPSAADTAAGLPGGAGRTPHGCGLPGRGRSCSRAGAGPPALEVEPSDRPRRGDVQHRRIVLARRRAGTRTAPETPSQTPSRRRRSVSVSCIQPASKRPGGFPSRGPLPSPCRPTNRAPARARALTPAEHWARHPSRSRSALSRRSRRRAAARLSPSRVCVGGGAASGR